MTEQSSIGLEHLNNLSVVDSAGDGERLRVYVRDSRDGSVFHVTFRANIMGEYKFDGSGGFDPDRREVIDAGRELAERYIRTTLMYPVKSKEEWTLVKPSTAKRILEDSDKYVVKRADEVADDE